MTYNIKGFDELQLGQHLLRYMCCSCASDSLQPVLKLSHIGFAAKTALITEGQFLQVASIRPQRFAAETAAVSQAMAPRLELQ